MDLEMLFNGIGDGTTRPDYRAIKEELERLREISNGFFSNLRDKEIALRDTGVIAVGLFNRAALLEADALEEYGNSLPVGETTDAFAEARILRELAGR